MSPFGRAILVFSAVAAATVAVQQSYGARQPEREGQEPPPFWSAAGPDGAPLAADAAREILLPPRGELRLTEPDSEIHAYESLTIGMRPLDAASCCEIDLNAGLPGGCRVVVRFQPEITVTILRAPGTPRETVLAEGTLGAVAAAGAEELLALRLRKDGIDIDARGHRLAASTELPAPRGALVVRARGGPLAVTSLTCRGRATNQRGKMMPFSWSESFQAPPAAGAADSAAASTWATSAMAAAALLAVTALFLRALVAAPAGALIEAAAALLGLPAAVLLALRTTGLPLVEPPLVATAPLAFVLALGVLRPWRAPAGRAGAGRAALLVAGAIGLLGAGAMATGAWHASVRSPLLAGEQVALARPEAGAVRLPGPLRLGADNAWTPPGRWRNLELNARLTLQPGALVGLRVRAPASDVPKGVLLLLSADERVPCGFRIEESERLEIEGETSPALAAGRPLALELVADGRSLEARVDGRRIARADSLAFPSGEVVLLAFRGEAEAEALSLRPLPGDTPPPEWPRLAAAALALPALAALVAALVAALSRRGYAASLLACSFAALPAGLVFALALREGELTRERFLLGGVCSGLTLLAVVAAWCGARRALGVTLGLCSLATVPAVLWWSPARTGMRDSAGVNRLGYVDWSGERLVDELLWLEHPLLRRWNDHLARHEFRGRTVRAEREPSVARVMTMGGSGTYGYRMPERAGLEWPAQLERLLASYGRQQVVNAAYIGATSSRLLRLYRDGLCRFAPDVVVLSVFYNDSTALSQGDEEGYFERMTTAGSVRTWLGDLRERLTRERERACLLRTIRGGIRCEDAAKAWRESGLTGWPPERFARTLHRFAQAAAERGAQLVLVKEPIAGDAPFLWKREFHAAMDAVGTWHGLLVVDPSPALVAAGGEALFLDDVHMRPQGHRVVAETLAPLVAQLTAPMLVER